MKVLFLIDSLGSGGAQRQMVTIACLLKKKDYDISFLVYSSSSFFLKQLEEYKIHVNKIGSHSFIKRVLQIRKFVRRGNFDVVISFMDTPNFLNCFAALGRHEWKVITSERSCKDSTFTTKKNLFFNYFQRFSDAIVCNSERAMRKWNEYYPFYVDKLKVIYNTVVLPEISYNYKPIEDGKIRLVVAASYQGLKNPIGLVMALSLLSNEERNMITVEWYGRRNVGKIGGTKIYEECLLLINKNKLESVITLHESTNDIHNKMIKADFVGLFSTVEGLPNVVCEAMTMSKPIIMTKVSDYDVLVDDSNGVVCESTKPEAIASGLRKILTFASDDIMQMGECSKNKAERMFNSEKVTSQWVRLITGKKYK